MENSNPSPESAIIDFVHSGTYPDSEAAVSAELPALALPSLLKELGNEREKVQAEVRELSHNVAPDVDGWIQQAKQLQLDIERSRATARDIVRLSEEAIAHRAKRDDAANKANLLSVEVEFTQNLRRNLEIIQVTAARLNQGQAEALRGHVKGALPFYLEADTTLTKMFTNTSTHASELLHHKARRLKDNIVEGIERHWKTCVHVDHGRVEINKYPKIGTGLDASTTSVEDVAVMSAKLEILDSNVAKLSRDLDTAFLKPLLSAASNAKVVALAVDEDTLYIREGLAADEPLSVMESIVTFVNFLDNRLPAAVTTGLSQKLMPSAISRLIAYWLVKSVPVSLEAMHNFQILLERVSRLANALTTVGWIGSAELLEWVDQAPRVWLARQRESCLDATRRTLSKRIHNTKTVERVETQTISSGDLMAGSNGMTNDWNTAWVEEETEGIATESAPVELEEEDDTSAWEVEDQSEQYHDEIVQSQGSHAPLNEDEEQEDADAWGWGEQNAQSSAPSPVISRNPKPQTNGNLQSSEPKSQEMTLRESYTITAVPEEVLQIVIQVAHNADTLRQPTYTESPIAPAAAALYSLPTLVLAGYRALAPTYYSSLNAGNMFLYNDSMRLAETLQAFDTEQTIKDAKTSLSKVVWPSTRMNLSAEIAALESFGKRAYGKEMESQRTILRDLLDGAQGFANCTEPPFAAQCENAVAATVDRLRELARQWIGVLSLSALLQSLGSLFSTVLNKVIIDIEDMSDIGEEESKRLRHFCDEFAKLSELFHQDSPQARQEGKSDMTGVYTPNWFKFMYLAEILDSHLADVKYMWTEGQLRLDFEAQEMVDLVEALFAESELRRKTIAEIRRA